MIKNISRSSLLFIVILVVASVLRLYQLGSVPPSPDWDEVALSYNGWSIFETGKDEYGSSFPVVLRSFDDYKPGLYAYLTIPTVQLFELTTFATRLPSALFGIATVVAVYFLIKELFKKEKFALLVSFLLAISPWHIQFSRLAFETNVGLSFNIFAALFFVKGLKKPWMLSLAALSSALAIYTYQSEKVFTPIFILILVILYFKEFIKLPKKFLAAAVITGIIAIAPMAIYITTNEQALLRAQATFAFSDTTNFLARTIPRLEYDHQTNNYLGLVFDNRRILYLVTGASGYLSHFDINWLFLKGDIQRHHAPGMALLYLWELPFLLIGIYSLLFRKVFKDVDKRVIIFFFAWFLLAPVPAAFTSGVPHAVRTLNFLPTFQVFVAAGLFASYLFMKEKKVLTKKFSWIIVKRKSSISSILIVFVVIMASLNFGYYLNQYFVQQNYFHSGDWQYGFKEVVDEVKSIENKYRKIVVSEEEPLDQAYMFFLFYYRYPPQKYQQESKALSGGFEQNHNFSKFEFRPIDWKNEKKDPSILYIGRPQDFDDSAKILKVIRFLNGKPVMYLVQG